MNFTTEQEQTLQQLDTRTSSVTVKQTAKGEYYWEIKVYFDKDKEPVTEVVTKFSEIDSALKTAFGGIKQ